MVTTHGPQEPTGAPQVEGDRRFGTHAEAPERSPDSGREERVIGSYGGEIPGPLLFLLCGVHGNEPAGVIAARRVLERLYERRPEVRGRIVATAGNLAALERGVRYVDRDLNRIWSWEDLERVRREDTDSESREQREITRELAGELARQPEDVVLFDLHTTSAHGSPFTIINDTLRNRRFASALGVPILLGLEENLQGTLLDFLGNYGCAAVGLEGGQHDAPEAVANHEAAIWITLVEAGLLRAAAVPELQTSRDRLRAAAAGQPAIVDVVHREEIAQGADFTMLPGFRNFQRIEKGRLLANTGPADAEVRCPRDGILIMPRYQGQGSDGFFIGRPIQPFWVRLSGILRRMRLHRILSWLPGICRRRDDATDSWVLELDQRIARWFSDDVMHLFGYRRIGTRASRHLFTRRVEHSPELSPMLADFRKILGEV